MLATRLAELDHLTKALDELRDVDAPTARAVLEQLRAHHTQLVVDAYRTDGTADSSSAAPTFEAATSGATRKRRRPVASVCCSRCGVAGHHSASWLCAERVLSDAERAHFDGTWYACVTTQGARYASVFPSAKSVGYWKGRFPGASTTVTPCATHAEAIECVQRARDTAAESEST